MVGVVYSIDLRRIAVRLIPRNRSLVDSLHFALSSIRRTLALELRDRYRLKRAYIASKLTAK